MDRLSSAARRRTLDSPARPEAGLAEWTSKIKAMQKQVDDDEEAETRRLEQEIQASRLARMRRSAGYGSRAGSVDLCKSLSSKANSDIVRALKNDEPDALASESPASTQDKAQNQEDALRKLMGERRISSPARTTAPAKPRTSNSSEPMSLAAFIGGRATGPRLTKHAPQQDAHDPTQFEQRTHVSIPHPIFGRGGVAMPGMAGRSPSSASSVAALEDRETPAAVSSHPTGRDRKFSTPSSVKSFVQKVESEALIAQKTGASQTSRQRTISTPTGTPVDRTVSSTPSREDYARPMSAASPRPAPLSSTTAYTPPLPSPSPVARQFTSSRSPPPLSPSASSSSKSSITTPSLARPIQPSPRLSLGPQLPSTSNPSPAFLKATPPKEPTPSISRLQGRGFVRSMVQATSQLTAASPSSPSLPERKDFGGKKVAPVLDRWQNNSTSSPAPSPPIISPKPVAMRKSRTTDSSADSPEFTPPRLVKSDYTGRSLRSVPSLPSIHYTGASSAPSASASDVGRDGRRTPGLGSSSTMLSYIKPIKTGDRPPTSAPPTPSRSRAASPEVDELGRRRRSKGRSKSRSKSRDTSRMREEIPTTGKSLSHLTKNRAKKPRKTKSAQAPSGSQDELHVHFASRAASLPELVSTTQVTELVVSLPTSDDPSTSNKSAVADKLPSPLETKFDDDFSPVPSKSVPEKPPKLAELEMPTTAVLAGGPKSPIVLPKSPVTPKEKRPTTPVRHARIPSTGNRATVMDVAQVFQESVIHQPALTPVSAEPLSVPQGDAIGPTAEQDQEDGGKLDVTSLVANWGTKNGAGRPDAPSEKRKSSFERYSAIVMPPLVEEKTPVPSPAGTLARNATAFQQVRSPDAPPSKTAITEVSSATVLDGEDVGSSGDSDQYIRIDLTDEPLPDVDVAALLKADRPVNALDADAQTISVDVMSVVGTTATEITSGSHIFYDMDVLAVIHRAKSRTTGLASTRVWAWCGKRSTVGEREERKLQEMARRYGTLLVMVHQYCEPEDLIALLGGQLITRQGARAHWSAENTTMHLVRSIGTSTFIDEVDLSIKNLCSGFSYCISLLDTFYVWHGCGSVQSERRAAQDYAHSLALPSSNVLELIEGETDSDEMFWMILGDGDYANADYWKWRSGTTDVYPRIWSVNAAKGSAAVTAVPSFANYPFIDPLIHVVDCVWEFFVVVGSDARGKRRDIKLALSVATNMSDVTASSRPFPPTIHVLILPSQLPTDLRLNFRDLDELLLNRGDVPDHMNLIPAVEAEEQIRKTTWERDVTQDSTMQPLGVHTSDLA
ncbi:hypothetical protein IEO21_02350 [Rhodonia placenta]|uniref:Gelsolin-like domain-containing protein n=1 Tax=Rhodonia placenta TaxID=104341 RepID=A0A8H7U576_9APHY|nr:hypothetical protein IEO21_02350 [Postia placenta]